MPSLAATKRVIIFKEEPEIIHVYVPYMEYERTHKHSLQRARQTHRKIRDNEAEPAYSSEKVVPHRSGPTVLPHALQI